MKHKLLIIILIFSYTRIYAQEKKYSINGYISQLNETIIDSLKGNWINSSYLQNRLKIKYYGIKNLTFDLEMRNRLIFGQIIDYNPNYAKYLDKDNGLLDLSFNIAKGKSFVLNSNIDRAYIQYEINKFKLTLGRQRINWAMTFVWNPNDLFNNYSFFDFDYVEKPGADAIDLQYFINYASNLEIAAKLNSDSALTAALKYSFNVFNYDFQIITGVLDNQDYAAGIGWTGNIKNITFRGEATYLQPKKNFFDTAGVLISSIGFDYMFKNSLTITTEFLYNQAKSNLNISNIYQIQNAPVNIKNLSFAEYNALIEASYPISPITNISLAAMWMNKNNWIFISPNITFSLNQNTDFTILGQFFTGKMLNPISLKLQQKLFSILFIRLKYNF